MNAPATALNPSTETAPMQPADFIAAMGKGATGVTVITTDGPAGRFGVTVSAMGSVSAEPPLLLVCVNRNNLAYAAIEHNRCFCGNLVAAEPQAVAQVFAGQLRAEPGDRVDCRIVQQHPHRLRGPGCRGAKPRGLAAGLLPAQLLQPQAAPGLNPAPGLKRCCTGRRPSPPHPGCCRRWRPCSRRGRSRP